jgi:hypothetical protein
MTSSIDGFYVAYLTGKAGSGFAMLILRNGKIIGADPLGVTYDGIYTSKTDDGYSVELESAWPPNIALILGGHTGPDGEAVQLNFDLGQNFTDKDYITIQTPRGPVNAKFVKIRNIDD